MIHPCLTPLSILNWLHTSTLSPISALSLYCHLLSSLDHFFCVLQQTILTISDPLPVHITIPGHLHTKGHEISTLSLLLKPYSLSPHHFFHSLPHPCIQWKDCGDMKHPRLTPPSILKASLFPHFTPTRAKLLMQILLIPFDFKWFVPIWRAALPCPLSP